MSIALRSSSANSIGRTRRGDGSVAAGHYGFSRLRNCSNGAVTDQFHAGSTLIHLLKRRRQASLDRNAEHDATRKIHAIPDDRRSQQPTKRARAAFS